MAKYGDKAGYVFWVSAIATFVVAVAVADSQGLRLATSISVAFIVIGAIFYFASRLERLQATEELRLIRTIARHSTPPPVAEKDREFRG